MKTIVLESQYLMPVSALHLIRSADLVYIDQFENYQKKTYRNRAHICNSSGVFRLTVPLEKGKNQQTLMKDVRISNVDAWQKHHWQSIVSAYNRSPYFEFYQDDLKPFYEREYEFLIDFNMDLLNFLLESFNLKKPVVLSTKYIQDEEILDYRNSIQPNKSKQSYFPELKSYPQVFSDRLPFQKDLSAIDLLFNNGPNIL